MSRPAGPPHLRARIRSVALACALASVAVSALTGASAFAAAPQVSLSQPVANSFTNRSTPSFSGATSEAMVLLSLNIYAGAHAEGVPLTTVTILPTFPIWSASAPGPLAQGRYTVQAEEVNLAGEAGKSAAVTFGVDTTPPVVAMNPLPSLTNDATPTLSGGAGTAEGDAPSVAVSIYEGTSAGGIIAARSVVGVLAGKWMYDSPRLGDGVYTAQATQLDEAGNLGTSTASTFSVDSTAPALSTLAPASGAALAVSTPTLRGVPGHAPGDLPLVSVRIYAGPSAGGTPVEQLGMTAAEWSGGTVAHALPDGQYTAVAEQSDLAGNVARNTVGFRVAAAPPPVTLSLTSAVSRPGQAVVDGTPSFEGAAGAAPEDSHVMLVRIYSGESPTVGPLQSIQGEVVGGHWSAGPAAALASGTYTAVAEQQDGAFFEHGGLSVAVVFTVDVDAPSPALSTPLNGAAIAGTSVALAGTGGHAEGDLPTVTVNVFTGSSATGQPLESLAVPVSAGEWHVTLGGLAPGIYTVQAEQSDDVGNTGFSAAVTLGLSALVPPTPSVTPESRPLAQPIVSAPAMAGSALPVAGFEWFPHLPHVGEPVSMISTSADLLSPITSYAWALAPGATFAAGASTSHVAFHAAGAQHIRLRVTDALGRAALVEHVVQVRPAARRLLEPFPVVRLAGSDFASRIRIRLLSVLAPLGSTVSVTCRGGGCPTGSETILASTRDGDTGLALVRLRRYERPLRAGAILQIAVSKAGEIGKYTRLEVLAHRLPRRTDTCLSTSGAAPLACPS